MNAEAEEGLGEFKYWAFLSYSHTDKKWGDWLHKALETYRVPRRLVGKESRDGKVPPRVFCSSLKSAKHNVRARPLSRAEEQTKLQEREAQRARTAAVEAEEHTKLGASNYMTGVNEEHLTVGYTKIRPGAGFLNTPIYVSAGRDDRIATVEQQYNVAGTIKRTGFQRIRIGTFHGGHEVNDAQTSIALRWFRELAK